MLANKIASLFLQILVIKFLAEFFEATLFYCGTDFFHKLIIEIKVMDNAKAHSQQFPCLEQVADICAGIGLAYGAIALFVDGAVIQLVFEVVNVKQAFACEQIAVAGIAGGHYAIEEIYTSVNSL